jgi:hypothetical protein
MNAYYCLALFSNKRTNHRYILVEIAHNLMVVGKGKSFTECGSGIHEVVGSNLSCIWII